MKYFHELTEKEYQSLHMDLTWSHLAKDYPQPLWCDYPHAVGALGCWSLIGHLVTGEDYCKDCRCHKSSKPGKSK